MAIIKMKKLRVMALSSDREALLSQLLHLGCVEIRDPGDHMADPEWAALLRRGPSDLATTKGRITDVNTALSALKKYCRYKDGLFIQRHPISEKEFLSTDLAQRAQETCDRINGLLQELSRLGNEEGRLLAKQAGLLPWKELDLPLERDGSEHVSFRLCVCPASVNLGTVRTALGAADAAAELLEISADRRQHYLLLVCLRTEEREIMELLRTYGFSLTAFSGAVGTAEENICQLDTVLRKNKERQEAIVQEISGCKDTRDALRVYADRLDSEAKEDADAERILTDGTIVFFEGWAPVGTLDAVEALLQKTGCAWDTADPTPEEYPEVPIQLKNNKFTKPLNMVTEMYSLPAYDGVDPNPLMAPFFILFYGIMMADMGYGLLMVLASVIIGKKYRPKGTAGNLFSLLGLCGISTFLMGVLTGSFFGDFLPQLVKIINPNTTFTSLPALFTPLNDTLKILIGSLVLGFIQVVTGMAVSFVKKTKDGKLKDAVFNEGTWWVIYAGTALAILKIGNIGKYPVVLIIGCVMLIIGSTSGVKGFGKIAAVVGAVYNGVTGIFSDVMSYSRLMALMLAGSIIAQVFNSLGSITNNVISFVIISMVGNALNFALNLLGCFVHDLRLQCLEYFNKFYKDGGKPFRPLAFQTKYVDIEEEN